ncbi:MAG: FtsK/SpoIIIE domain-containing protein, partial [Planctomycetota bacterium]
DGPPKKKQHVLHQVDTAVSAGERDLQWARELTIRRLNRYLDPMSNDEPLTEFDETKPTSVLEALESIARLNRRLHAVTNEMQTGLPSKIVDSFYLPAAVGIGIVIWAFGALLLRADPLLWWMTGGVPVMGVLGFAVYLSLMWPLRKMTRRLHPLSERIRIAVESVAREARRIADATCKKATQDLIDQRQSHLAEAARWKDEHLLQAQQETQAKADAQRQSLNEKLTQIDQQFCDGYAELQNTMRRRADETASTIQSTLADTDQIVDQTRLNADRQHRMTVDQLTARLQVALSRAVKRIDASTTILQQRHPSWTDILRHPSQPQASVDFLPLGTIKLGSSFATKLSHALTNDSNGNGDAGGNDIEERILKDIAFPDSMPLALHRRRFSGVLIQTPSAYLDQGVAIAHQLLWRLMSSAPAGKAKCTLLDPVGRGQHFANFMALGDHDPAIIHHRVWTTGESITHRLAELTQHVEDVLQVSLRDRFARIEDYNAEAGALAEPYHAIAAVGLPEGLSRDAYSHLNSLIQNGIRCGILVILVVNSDQTWPDDMQLFSSDRLCRLTFRADKRIDQNHEMGHWSCNSGGLDHLPFWPLSPPPTEIREPLLRRIGKAAADAATVTVPLISLLTETQRSSLQVTNGHLTNEASTSDGIQIVLGSQGAGRNLALRLGQGVQQHVLVVGKTGSGKSTLLHSLVTAGAIKYHADELQLYLLDFKKGVEFKVYADHPIPHARIIGIESEREFGLSVLQRLDDELTRRGEIFRDAGVGDLSHYRTAQPDQSMPRIMLVVDEFQELFARDDAIAADCTARLDRLVRQGRSFGIHIVLSSQSLAGTNSLPRATLGQMAVRVALQCGQSDDALVLSEDNHAARLLTHPGQAIYNNAGGLVEGNQPFQVAWLDHDTHVELLDQIIEREQKRPTKFDPPIVFEGNRPSQFDSSLVDQVQSSTHGLQHVVGLLGEAVELGPPAAIRLSAATGRNALLVAPPKMRRAVLACVMATQSLHAPNGQLVFFDGHRNDNEPSLGDWVTQTGLSCRRISPRDSESELARIAAEIESRLDQGADPDLCPWLIVIEPLDRFRDLRQSDAYQFSLDGDASERADQLFQKVLRDGPGVGIFCVVAMSSAETLTRWLPRQSHHDFELRLAGPLNASDSSMLLDSTIAADLAAATMVMVDDADGRSTKFRLCDPPTPDQLRGLLGRQHADNVATESSTFESDSRGAADSMRPLS